MVRFAAAACVAIAALACDGFGGPAAAQTGEEVRAATETVFARYAPRILQVQVVEVGSAARVATGTAFFVAADGRMLTNYHVISEWIHEPESHRIEVLQPGGEPTVATVLTVDVISDLAVLATGQPTTEYFRLGTVSLRQGERLYSLGYPGDLGLSIVEGTYNGELQYTLYPQIHVTGSINSGMSGGPTITGNGAVAGVNVATMGNQRGFLVPRERAVELLAHTDEPDFAPRDRFLDLIAEQVNAFQDAFLDGMFEGEVPRVEIGRFRVATEPGPIFRCWGGANREPERLVETLEHACNTDDGLYIADGQWAGTVSLHHQVERSTGLSARRFTRHLQSVFGEDRTPAGSERHVTRWSCTVRNVRVDATTARVAYCIRRLRKLGELYDVVVKSAVLGDASTGLISTLSLAGVSADNAERVATRWVELNGWQ